EKRQMSALRSRRRRPAVAIASACLVVAIGVAHAANPPVPWRVPPATSIPAGPLGDAVRLGQSIFNATQANVKTYVGNGLACTSCHLERGTGAYGAPLVGLWGVF